MINKQASKNALNQLVNRLNGMAIGKQEVCDRHADNPDSAAYVRAEKECTELLREKNALIELMKEAGL